MDGANRFLFHEVDGDGTTCFWCIWPKHDNHENLAIVAHLEARALGWSWA